MYKYRLLELFIICLSTSLFLQCSRPIELPPGDPDNGGLILPTNFEALVVADRTGRARHITVNDNGDIYVKLTYNDAMQGEGGTVGLRDINHDGKADTIVYFGDYKDEGGSAVGVTIHNGYLYTSTVRKVYRNKLTPGKLVPESETEVVLTDEDENVVRNWHTTKPLAFDNKGYMYVPFGSPSDACQDLTKFGPAGIPGGQGLDPCPELENHAGIWRFDANKINLTQKDGVKYATGIRSVVGMQWNPADQSLYAVVNGIDNFHTMFPDLFSSWQAAVLPAELLTKVKEGSNFGWPYAYYDHMQEKNVLQPGYGGDGKRIGRASEFDKPSIGFPGHWAPMDVLFYRGNQFPMRYTNGAFVAFHGSTDRSPYPQAGYIVCFVPFENGEPTGKWEVFADGFTVVDTVVNTSDAKYRPMGLAEGPDGSLYISESNEGKIWRVMFKGDKDKFGEAALEPMEKRKDRSYIKTPDEVADNLHRGDLLGGRILYTSYCATCHQRDGKGDNNLFPPLAGSELVTGDAERLIDIVLNGLQGEININGKTYNGLMPRNDHLDDHAIASILTYVRTRFNNNSVPISAIQVGKVRNKSAQKQ
ncbi:MAG: PQQ-dependent sugar dehydrogenase [Cyclobacteriaceae bacterium]|nr:PQQ-dependent sugar dehydrogenase [Cyclobacteriaceae bacterium]MDH4295949.1 PQQ-dependent sugar dehydrogenase [Cyclobacteriaceae bacterium]MDH5251094.1 PQQ-dependent sugar dehydrogenase [Cyclobacteriaceae bacterium]